MLLSFLVVLVTLLLSTYVVFYGVAVVANAGVVGIAADCAIRVAFAVVGIIFVVVFVVSVVTHDVHVVGVGVTYDYAVALLFCCDCCCLWCRCLDLPHC